jgi:ATP-dependent DNA helicase RecG
MTLDPDSFQRIGIHEYPRPVLRELVINMLAHRDYAIYGSTSRVQLFRNRIEWASPGRLPAGMTVQSILQEQHRRNPNIARILYQSGLVESLGQGLNTVVATLRNEDMLPPEFHDTGASFIVTVFGYDYRAAEPDSILQEQYNLTNNQLLIYQYIQQKEMVSPREIRELFLDRSERGLQRDLKFMIDAGLLTTHGGSRSLRYSIAQINRDPQ